MTTTPFKEGINEILSLMTQYNNLAVMCAEALPWRCHRRMIADYLSMLESVSVYNIINCKQQPGPQWLTLFDVLLVTRLSFIQKPILFNKITCSSLFIMYLTYIHNFRLFN